MNPKEINNQLNKALNTYLNAHYPTHRDVVNDLSRELIEACKNEWGSAWLIRVNPWDDDEPVYFQYTGQMIYNFGADAVVPVYDADLENIIKERLESWESASADAEKIAQIFERINDLGGYILVWS